MQLDNKQPPQVKCFKLNCNANMIRPYHDQGPPRPAEAYGLTEIAL